MSKFNAYLPPIHSRVDVVSDSNNIINRLAKRFGIEFLNALGSGVEAVPEQANSEHQLYLPADIGSGWVRHQVVRSGVEVTLIDFSLKHPIVIRGGRTPSLIELGFWQMGQNVHYRFDFGKGIIRPNQVHLSRIPMPYEGEALYPRDERMMGISLSIAPEVFWTWLADNSLPSPLRGRLAEASQIVMEQQPIPSVLKLPLLQMRETTWQGAMSRLYIEAKVMEIVALYAQHLAPETASAQPHLTHDDIDRLHQARAILLARMDDPPSLSELAQAVFLNDHKLKIGFKAIFGTTVFGLLYEHRMAQARDLLESRRYSIAEVALQVGYRSPSAFSAAFKRKYGSTPRDVQS